MVKLGMDFEIRMVRSIFKHGGLGFRAPGSGTYVVEQEPIPYNELQQKCKIEIDVDHVDLGYNISNNVTTDYSGYFTDKSISPLTKIFGDCEKNEFRFVEVKTVRLRKNHLSKKERDSGKKIKAKSHKMWTTFSLLEKDKREHVKINDPEKRGKKKTINNPYFNTLRKSNFCMELQRTWYLSLLGKDLDIFKCQVNSYLQVRFVGASAELFIKISTLVKWQNWEKKTKRDPKCSKLHVEKDDVGIVTWRWR